MDREKLINAIQFKKTFLCIGLDSDINKIPTHLLELDDPIFEFNKAIIDATKDLCIAYKINTAFYESNAINGWNSMQKTLDYIPNDIFTIADAKRGDIGNTSKMYAKAFFENLNYDSITVNPYMGSDSVKPFLSFDDKWVILLALTSNAGSKDFQHLKFDDKPLYQHVFEKSSKWGSEKNLMYVVGANNPQFLEEIRY
jgi:orotidine-5'-phosphate decarboxylase